MRARENRSNTSASQRSSSSIRIRDCDNEETVIDEREHDEDVARYMDLYERGSLNEFGAETSEPTERGGTEVHARDDSCFSESLVWKEVEEVNQSEDPGRTRSGASFTRVDTKPEFKDNSLKRNVLLQQTSGKR